MNRREWVACLGAGLGCVIARSATSWLATSAGWPELAAHEPATARYLTAVLIVPLPFVGAILSCCPGQLRRGARVRRPAASTPQAAAALPLRSRPRRSS